MKYRSRRFIAFFLVVALVLSGSKNIAQAQEAEIIFEKEGWRIVISEQASWGEGYIAQAAVTNMNTTPITNWEIQTSLKNGAIEDVWNVTAEKAESGYTLTCQSYNRKIAAGETVTFGFRALGAGIKDIANMELTQKKKGTMKTGDYALSYYIASQWENGATLEVTIHNNTNQTIHNWELSCRLDADITSIWGAALLGQENGVYTIDGSNGEADIKAGGEVSFGMNLAQIGKEGICPFDESLCCTDGILIKEEDTVEEATTEASGPTTQKEQEKTTEEKDSSSDKNHASGEAITTEEQDNLSEADTGWDDTMIRADDEARKQYGEKAQDRVKIAVIDSGIDYWKDINVVERANFVTDCEDSSPLFDDLSGHGTATAALLAADPDKWNGEKPDNQAEEQQEQEEEQEEAAEYEDLTEEDMENIDFSAVQTLTGQTIVPETEDKTKTANQELKDVLEALAKQQVQAEYEEEEGKDEETQEEEQEAPEESTTEAISEEEQREEESSIEGIGQAKEPEGMEAFANLFNGENKTIRGVNPNVDIYSARVLDDDNEAEVTKTVEAIEWAIEKEVQIIQIGFGIEKDSAKLHQAIKKAYEKGILLIAPAGNEEAIQYPAKYEEVIAVGSVNCEGKKGKLSAMGEELELVAPGELVCSRGAFGILEQYSGTSMAVPQVVGLASLLWQMDLSQPADCIRQLMDTTANSLGARGEYGYGLIDCQEAMEKYEDFVAWYTKQHKQDSSQEAAEQVQEQTDKEDMIEQAQEELGENEQPVLVVEKEIVKGCWNREGHIKTINKKIKALNKGVTWSDQKESKIAGMTANPAFHGYYQKYSKDGKKTKCNYIEGYRCLVKAAQYFKEHGTLESFNYTVPKGSNGLCGMVKKLKKKSMTDNIINQSVGKNGHVVFGREDWETGAYFVYGMALHTLADIFSHSAYSYNSYTYNNSNKGIRLTKAYGWSAIRHGSCVIQDKKYYLSNQSDRKSYKPQRYKQAQVVVKTALDSIGNTESITFDNPTSGTIMVFSRMQEAVSLEQADQDVHYEVSGNAVSADAAGAKEVSGATRNSYIKKQFALNRFLTCLKQSYDASADAAALSSLKQQYGGQLSDEEVIRQKWQVFDNSYVKQRITGWKRLSFKVKSLKFSATIKKFKIIDVTKSKANIAYNKKYKKEIADKKKKKKKEIVTVKLKNNAMPLTKKHTYMIILKGTKVKKSSIAKAAKAKAQTLSRQSIAKGNNGGEETYAAIKLFTVGEDQEEQYSEEFIPAGGTVNVELTDADMAKADVRGGVVELTGTLDHVGNAIKNRTIYLYQWEEDLLEKIDSTYCEDDKPEPCYETTTDAEGGYCFQNVAPGKYTLYIEEDDKYMMHWEDITVKTGAAEVHNELIRLAKQEYKGKSIISGTIRNATDSRGVEGLKVQVQAAGRTLTGTTDAQGFYRIKYLFGGEYYAKVSDPKGQYASTSFRVTVDGRKEENPQQDVIVSKKMEEGQMRIVATWGAGNPAYEGHVAIMDESNPLFLVDLYHNYVHEDYEIFKREKSCVAAVYGSWEKGDAPESFTLYDTDISYDYHLFNFNFEASATAEKELKRELVKVEVYEGIGDKATLTLYAPYQDGLWWNAFHYDSKTKTIKQVNKMTEYKSFHEYYTSGNSPWKNEWQREPIRQLVD